MTAAEIITILQTLTQLGLTGTQVKALMDAPERTEADVQAQLDATDATIQAARDDN